MSKMVSDKKI